MSARPSPATAPPTFRVGLMAIDGCMLSSLSGPADALHIALAAVTGMNFLVTWNCTHIANGFVLQKVNALCRDSGYEPPVVCTPQELMEG